MGDLADMRLRTNCEACVNKCCSRPLDWVYVTEREIASLEDASSVSRVEFIETIRNDLVGLTFQTLQLSCRFLDSEGKCRVYEARPLICRLFPFYPDLLAARLMFLPAECGDRVQILDDEAVEGWSATDYASNTEAWFAAMSEAMRK